jgi:hypothetical protein
MLIGLRTSDLENRMDEALCAWDKVGTLSDGEMGEIDAAGKQKFKRTALKDVWDEAKP